MFYFPLGILHEQAGYQSVGGGKMELSPQRADASLVHRFPELCRLKIPLWMLNTQMLTKHRKCETSFEFHFRFDGRTWQILEIFIFCLWRPSFWMQKYFPITFAGACTDVWLHSKLNRLSTSPLSTSPLSTSPSTSTSASSLQRTDDPPVMSAFLYLFKWDRGCEYILAKFQTRQIYIWFCHKLNKIGGEKLI